MFNAKYLESSLAHPVGCHPQHPAAPMSGCPQSLRGEKNDIAHAIMHKSLGGIHQRNLIDTTIHELNANFVTSRNIVRLLDPTARKSSIPQENPVSLSFNAINSFKFTVYIS